MKDYIDITKSYDKGCEETAHFRSSGATIKTMKVRCAL